MEVESLVFVKYDTIGRKETERSVSKGGGGGAERSNVRIFAN